MVVDQVMLGKTPVEACTAAGYEGPREHSHTIMKSTAIQTALRDARDELSSVAQITRADVIDGIMEAVKIAKLNADPATMVKGWSEVGKMLGYYAPEVKRLEISADGKRLQQKFEVMSDAELYAMLENGQQPLDGEATRVE